MMPRLFAQSLTCLALILATTSTPAATLCLAGEVAIVAFQMKSNKLLNVCKGPKAAYAVYRFGLPGKIELQFPQELDAGSWKKFTYQLVNRRGGKNNTGFSQRTLTFTHAGVSYDIYETWIADTDKYENGVRVFDGKKDVNLTARGSLSPEAEDEARFAQAKGD